MLFIFLFGAVKFCLLTSDVIKISKVFYGPQSQLSCSFYSLCRNTVYIYLAGLGLSVAVQFTPVLLDCA